MVVKVVLTGGPCAGKSSVLKALRLELRDRAVFAEEAATKLFAGFPAMPLPQPCWTGADWLALQRAITATQLAHEAEASALAHFSRWPLVICDRAPRDNLAYPMGAQAVAEYLGRDESVHFGRYGLVLHMESLATARPEMYGRIGNNTRYESLAEAQALEMRTRAAWQGHPNWVFLPGALSVKELSTEVLRRIKEL